LRKKELGARMYSHCGTSKKSDGKKGSRWRVETDGTLVTGGRGADCLAETGPSAIWKAERRRLGGV